MKARRGLLSPFQRDRKRDFASGSGTELLRSKLRQVLLTRGAAHGAEGEMPWRTSFGSALDRLRHQRNDAVLAELARVYVRDALAKWIPSAKLTRISIEREGSSIFLKIRVSARGIELEESYELDG